MNWYIWYVYRKQFVNGQWVYTGSWFPSEVRQYTDHDAWRMGFDIEKSNLDSRAYRMMWNGSEWVYDQRLLA